MIDGDLPGKISVIMPALNEQDVIRFSIQETARTLGGCDSEIIVVDDGSDDATYERAQNNALLATRVRVLRCDDNKGKGWALRCGFEAAEGDLIVFLDADLDLPPSQIWALWEVMKKTGAQVVIGSKRHPESRLDYPWQRRVLSAVYFFLVKWLFGFSLRDTQTGIKLFRRQVLQQAFPRMKVKRFAFDLELLVVTSRLGYRIAEAPVTLRFQRERLGRIRLGSILRMIWDTLDVFYRASFWKWLSPSWITRAWMFLFTAGLFIFGVGLGNLLVTLHVPPILRWVVDILSLRFMDRTLRNVVIILLGLSLLGISLVQLNKSLLRAFGRQDTGDLAGTIAHSMGRSHQEGTGAQEKMSRDERFTVLNGS